MIFHTLPWDCDTFWTYLFQTHLKQTLSSSSSSSFSTLLLPPQDCLRRGWRRGGTGKPSERLGTFAWRLNESLGGAPLIFSRSPHHGQERAFEGREARSAHLRPAGSQWRSPLQADGHPDRATPGEMQGSTSQLASLMLTWLTSLLTRFILNSDRVSSTHKSTFFSSSWSCKPKVIRATVGLQRWVDVIDYINKQHKASCCYSKLLNDKITLNNAADWTSASLTGT